MDRTVHPRTAIRRTRLWLLLPLLLALAQQGAWLHALSHAAYAANPHRLTVEQAQCSFENGVCPTCQSFGQLGSALCSSLAALPAPTTPPSPQTAPRYSQPAAQLPAPRNRGPPLPA
ncbi:MAG TPA: hypothetical protein VIY90_00760 [Steroidobacteraceae bacterium]